MKVGQASLSMRQSMRRVDNDPLATRNVGIAGELLNWVLTWVDGCGRRRVMDACRFGDGKRQPTAQAKIMAR